MRYNKIYDQNQNRWLVVDSFLGDQPLGVHRTELDAITHAESQERQWCLYRTPAEDVALMMA